MPKIKEWFTQLKEQGKIENEDFDKFLEAAPDVEIPDIAIKAFDEHFMTLDRAVASKDVRTKLRAEILNPIDNEVAELAEKYLKDFVDPVTLDELKKNNVNSYNKIKLLKKIIPETIDKVKKAAPLDDDGKERIRKAEQGTREMIDRIKAMEAEKDKFANQLQDKFATDLHNVKLDYHLRDLTKKYKLAEAYEKNRDDLTQMFISNIRGSNTLKLEEKEGKAQVYILDEAGSPKFNGNSPVTIENLLEEKFKPYLQQSAGGAPPPNNPQPRQTTPPNPAIRRGASTTVQVK
jgi:hypothetical protein